VARAASIGGLLGIALALVRRRPDWKFIAVLFVVPTLLTAPFQPIARYLYLVFAPLVFAQADLRTAPLALAGWRFLSAGPAPNGRDRQAA